MTAAACGHLDFDVSQAGPPRCDDPGLQAGSPWPVQAGCVDHQGRSARTGPHALQLKWMVPLDGANSTWLASDHRERRHDLRRDRG